MNSVLCDIDVSCFNRGSYQIIRGPTFIFVVSNVPISYEDAKRIETEIVELTRPLGMPIVSEQLLELGRRASRRNIVIVAVAHGRRWEISAYGATYPIRDVLKQIGLQWTGQRWAGELPPEQLRKVLIEIDKAARGRGLTPIYVYKAYMIGFTEPDKLLESLPDILAARTLELHSIKEPLIGWLGHEAARVAREFANAVEESIPEQARSGVPGRLLEKAREIAEEKSAIALAVALRAAKLAGIGEEARQHLRKLLRDAWRRVLHASH